MPDIAQSTVLVNEVHDGFFSWLSSKPREEILCDYTVMRMIYSSLYEMWNASSMDKDDVLSEYVKKTAYPEGKFNYLPFIFA